MPEEQREKERKRGRTTEKGWKRQVQEDEEILKEKISYSTSKNAQ